MAENLDINTKDTSKPAATAKSLMNDAWASNINAQTAQQLTSITLVRQARINQQQREATALTAEYGATDSGVVALNASISDQQSLAGVLGATRDIATTTAPTVPQNGWILHGRVRDKNLQPIATLTICLVDEQKSFLSAYGYAYTDATGYYSITYTPDPSAPAPAPLSAYLEILNSSPGRPSLHRLRGVYDRRWWEPAARPDADQPDSAGRPPARHAPGQDPQTQESRRLGRMMNLATKGHYTVLIGSLSVCYLSFRAVRGTERSDICHLTI